MESKKLKLPNFICVGAQKAGTTAFYDMIVKHPEVTMSSIKEVHFFDRDENYKKGIDWYSSFFSNNKKIIGEITPDYLLYNQVPARIKKVLGTNIKLLFILRNPIERAYSQYNFHIMKGVEFRENFKNILQEETLDLENLTFKNWHTPAYYLSRGLYANQINRYLKYFDKENMHFVLFEDLFGANQEKELNSIFNFLEIGNFQINDTDHANSSLVPKKGISKLFLNTIRKNSFLLNKFKKVIPNKTYTIFRSLLISKMQKRPKKLTTEFKIKINNHYFKNDILELEKIINKDLSSWLK